MKKVLSKNKSPQDQDINPTPQEEQEIIILPHEESLSFRAKKNNEPYLNTTTDYNTATNNNDQQGENEEHDIIALSQHDEYQDHDLNIPSPKDDIYEQTVNSTRLNNNIRKQPSSIPSFKCCPICLEAYKAGDEIAWSKNDHCYHAYHSDCIVGWLMERNECPMCRRDYLCCNDTEENNV